MSQQMSLNVNKCQQVSTNVDKCANFNRDLKKNYIYFFYQLTILFVSSDLP